MPVNVSDVPAAMYQFGCMLTVMVEIAPTTRELVVAISDENPAGKLACKMASESKG
jgi:hypothetical protein